MYHYDPFLRMGQAFRIGHTRRSGRIRRSGRVRWQWGWRQARPEDAVRRPYRRRLAGIERQLAADAPALAARFKMFNQLTRGERPVGAEQVRLLASPGQGRVRLALLLVLAAFAALCVTLSIRGNDSVPLCPAAAVAGHIAHAPVRDLPCRAYPTAK